MRRVFQMLAIGACALGLAGASGTAVALRVQMNFSVRGNVHLSFRAPPLHQGGYYYAVMVLKPYKHYTKASPPCSVSSDMQRADYGYPKGGNVALALTPAKSRTGHWCAEGRYEGAVYAVPHAPPCESAYPCRSEPYEPPSACWNIEGRRVCGVVALPRQWRYPSSLPTPLWPGTRIVGRFVVRFPGESHS
jgi:hypothetical protein